MIGSASSFLMGIGVIILIATCIALYVWACIFAYRNGQTTGNVTVSIVLIVIGAFFGITLIPGLCHLVGTTNAPKKKMPFSDERKDLENEKLRAEIEYYKAKVEEMKDAEK